MADDTQGREITLEQMMALRAPTEAISSWLRSELEDRLETLRPLLAPRRFLGHHLRSAQSLEVKGADKLFDELQATYKEAAGEPLKLSTRLGSPLDPISTDLTLHSWEYTHEASEESGSRRITVKSPVSWVLTYAAPLSLAQVRQMATGAAPRDEAQLRQFAISACVMKLALARSAGLTRLLQALRIRVSIATSPETGKLPLAQLLSCVPAFRPSDNIVLSATRLSGVPTFEELVDVQGTSAIEDPLRAKVSSLAGSA
jgi:hypothetical protein